MKPRLCFAFALTAFSAALFLVPAPLPAQTTLGSGLEVEAVELFTEAELDQLLAPVALHPDALVALILPAATEAADVVLAARYLSGKRDPAQIDDQPWDDAVRALARYPEVVTWLDENLAWTQRLGEAFAAQPADVMRAIQRLRAQARATGALTDTAEQLIVVRDEQLCILPAQPHVIYVPRYDPAVVYVRHTRPHYQRTWITFSVGCPVGAWLAYDCDWRHRRIWVVARPHRPHHWQHRHDWRHPSFPGEPGYVDRPGRQPWERRHRSPGQPGPGSRGPHQAPPRDERRFVDLGPGGAVPTVGRPAPRAPGAGTRDSDYRWPSREERRRASEQRQWTPPVTRPAPVVQTPPPRSLDRGDGRQPSGSDRGPAVPGRRFEPRPTSITPPAVTAPAPLVVAPPPTPAASPARRSPRPMITRGAPAEVAVAPVPAARAWVTAPAPSPAPTAAVVEPSRTTERAQPWTRGQSGGAPGRSGRAEARQHRDS